MFYSTVRLAIAGQGNHRHMRTTLGLLMWFGCAFTASALAPVAAGDAGKQLSATEIEELVGPVALYPDELLAVVLPASTFPVQVVQAARFLDKKKSSPDLQPSKKWDQSVLAVINYPEVVQKLNDDLEWTERLGEAVLNQQEDVLEAVQQFRAKTHAAGNLESDKQQVIVVEKEVIRIEPAETKIVYVPTYEPATVIVQQPATVVHYSTPYPYYYDPAAAFFIGVFTGVAMSYAFDWHDHYIHHGLYDGHHGGINIDDSNINIDRSKNITVGDRERTGDDRSVWNGGDRKRTTDRTNQRTASSADIRKRLGEPSAKRGDIGSSQRSQARQANRGVVRSQRTANTGTGDRRQTKSRDQSSVQRGRSRSGAAKSRNTSRTSGAFSGYQRGSNTVRNSNRGNYSRSRSAGGSGRSMGGGRRR